MVIYQFSKKCLGLSPRFFSRYSSFLPKSRNIHGLLETELPQDLSMRVIECVLPYVHWDWLQQTPTPKKACKIMRNLSTVSLYCIYPTICLKGHRDFVQISSKTSLLLLSAVKIDTAQLHRVVSGLCGDPVAAA